ncbi:Fibronectin type III domain [Nesidiocoris tenuis]|uniref:Fibronectin type III domain n=1 Tax=Nesidiocoris tenuis TaxID=355587 RepID=A0ABN7BE31_9HEMI|nr:Fibronectin type III domain [Nesidiocoris tenuis]
MPSTFPECSRQVLKKVKLAPQRTWSEDSQGSPPRDTPDSQPVPPKRRHRPPTIDEQVSPPATPAKKERKLPPHLQKEFDRVYAQMGARETSPGVQAMNQRMKNVVQETRSSRKSAVASSEQPVAKTRMPSKSPRRRDRESRTPSTVREVTPRGSLTPDSTRPVTPKFLPGDPELDRIAEAQAKKEEELRRKEEELLRKMEELKRREEQMKLEEERRELDQLKRQKRLEDERKQQKSEKVQWGRELSHEIHSSSEMMLVLLPSNEDQVGDDEPRVTADDLKVSGGVAPPMSLSAPVLGGSEMPPPSLRAAVSSSEIMYELTMARLNKEADEEEAEAHLRLRYGLDRKRSFERRAAKEDLAPLKDTVSMENLSRFEKKLSEFEERTALESEVESSPSPIPPSRASKEKSRTESFSERFMQLERNFENYNERFDFDERRPSDVSDIMESSFDYYDEVEEEETYHPRTMGAGVFTPIAVQLPTREFAEVIPTPTTLAPPPLITINEEADKDGVPARVRSEEIQKPIQPIPKKQEPKIERVIIRETVSPDRLPEPPPKVKRRSPSPNVQATIPVEPEDRKLTPSPTSLKPKPILKVRDRSAERSDRSDVSDSESGTKRVRIEEPRDKNNIDMYAKEENDMGLQAGEVARNRRKSQQPSMTPAAALASTAPLAPAVPMSPAPPPAPSTAPAAAPAPIPSTAPAAALASAAPLAPAVPLAPAAATSAMPAVKASLAASVAPAAPAALTKKEEEPVVVVNIYSDIIREFSHQRSAKPKPKLYLNYDELKQAADKVQEAMIDDLQVLEHVAKHKKPPPKAAKVQPSKASPTKEEKDLTEKTEDDPTASDQPISTLPSTIKRFVEYLLDLCLFLVALWLYLFKDPRLSIPIIVLMIYRQLDQTVKARISSIGGWFRKKED